MSSKDVKKGNGRSAQPPGQAAAQSKQDQGTAVFEKIWDLSNAIKEGRLDTRIDLSGTEGNDRETLDVVNQMIDMIVKPLHVTADYVEKISKGEIPAKITDSYNGDFNRIKDNLNNCVDGLQGLVECNNVMHRMAVNDHTKGVEGKYVGIFASMGEATNEVRERLTGCNQADERYRCRRHVPTRRIQKDRQAQ